MQQSLRLDNIIASWSCWRATRGRSVKQPPLARKRWSRRLNQRRRLFVDQRGQFFCAHALYVAIGLGLARHPVPSTLLDVFVTLHEGKRFELLEILIMMRRIV